jgi:hypothetical protein
MKVGFIGGGNMAREAEGRNCEAVIPQAEAASHTRLQQKADIR